MTDTLTIEPTSQLPLITRFSCKVTRNQTRDIVDSDKSRQWRKENKTTVPRMQMDQSTWAGQRLKTSVCQRLLGHFSRTCPCWKSECLLACSVLWMKPWWAGSPAFLPTDFSPWLAWCFSFLLLHDPCLPFDYLKMVHLQVGKRWFIPEQSINDHSLGTHIQVSPNVLF